MKESFMKANGMEKVRYSFLMQLLSKEFGLKILSSDPITCKTYLL